MKVDLLYLSDNPYGGWMTYTRHLHDALMMLGVEVAIIKFRERSSNTVRNLGYGLQYHTYSAEDYAKHLASSRQQVALITATQKNYAERANYLAGSSKRAFVVIHDHNELKHYGPRVLGKRTVVIRPVGKKLVPGATFIPHPYIPYFTDIPAKTKHAISVSRIDHDKNTHLLLLANRKLPKKLAINIRGFENRIYTRFTIMPKFPEWKQSVAHFPREKLAAVQLLAPYRFMVDMSTIKGDGGGSQYTFLEAADAGCCIILNAKWILNARTDEMHPGDNCLVVSDEHALANAMRTYDMTGVNNVARGARALLAKHEPKKIARQYIKFFT